MIHAIDAGRNAEVWQGRVSGRIGKGSLEPAAVDRRRVDGDARLPGATRRPDQSSDWRKSTPSERSLRYRCVRSMPTRLASWPTLPLHSCSCWVR